MSNPINSVEQFVTKINQIKVDLANNKWIDTNLEGRTKNGKIVRFFKGLLRFIGVDLFRDIRMDAVVKSYVKMSEAWKRSLSRQDQVTMVEVLKTLQKRVTHINLSYKQEFETALKDLHPTATPRSTPPTIPPSSPKKMAPKFKPETSAAPATVVPAPQEIFPPVIAAPAPVEPPVQEIIRPATPEVKALPTVEEYSAPLAPMELSLIKLRDLMSKGFSSDYDQVKNDEKMSNMVEEDIESQTVELNLNGMNNLKTSYESRLEELVEIHTVWPKLVQEIKEYDAANKPASPIPAPSAMGGIPPLPPLPMAPLMPMPPNSPRAKNLSDEDLETLLKDNASMDDKIAKFEEGYARRTRVEEMRADANKHLFPNESSNLDCEHALPYLEKAILEYRQKVNELEAKKNGAKERLARINERKENERRDAAARKAQEEQAKYAGVPAPVVLEIKKYESPLEVLKQADENVKKGEGTPRAKSEMERHCRTINTLMKALNEEGLSQTDRNKKKTELETAEKQRHDIRAELVQWQNERAKTIALYSQGCAQLKTLISGSEVEPSNEPQTLDHLQKEAKRLRNIAESTIQDLKDGKIEVLATTRADSTSQNRSLDALRKKKVSVGSGSFKLDLKEQLGKDKSERTIIKKPSIVTPPDAATLAKRQFNSTANSLKRRIADLSEDVKSIYSANPFLNAEAAFKSFLETNQPEEASMGMISMFYACHERLLTLANELAFLVNASELKGKSAFDEMVANLAQMKNFLSNEAGTISKDASYSEALISYQNWLSEFIDQISQFFNNKYPIRVIAVNLAMIGEKETGLPDRFKNNDGLLVIRKAFESYNNRAEKQQIVLDNVSALTINYMKLLNFMTALDTYNVESGREGYNALISTSNEIKVELKKINLSELESSSESFVNWFEGFSSRELDNIDEKLSQSGGPAATLMANFSDEDE